MSKPPPSSAGIREQRGLFGIYDIYFFCTGSPWHVMVPSPPVVTMNSEPHILQEYLFPVSLANSSPLILAFRDIIAFGVVSVNLASRGIDEGHLCLEAERWSMVRADRERLV